MYKRIYEEIKKYNNIVIARHIGVDPDALSSQLALRDSIRLTFPEKNVIAIGTGSNKFTYMGKLDKMENFEGQKLLIVTDTPDTKRIDGAHPDDYDFVIKLDHHVNIEDFADLEVVDEGASSACEVVLKLIDATELECNSEVFSLLYLGLVADSNRFLFNTCTASTFGVVSKFMEKYPIDISKLYNNLYLRPMNEVRLEGYISQNMVVTPNKLGYIQITNDVINQFSIDSASAGNMVNNFNFINEVVIWATITEDVKNEIIRISIRSRGPAINKVAEIYGGGGHKMASGARVKSFEDAQKLMDDLDELLKSCNEEVI